ncbi:glycerophosphodiester phosphodiesterase family protein [Pseudovibrio denitrificans]|uniref:glycerophosphodiester phosphodiesterase family protein n=1 Tax=Pseudovibrio denitrificans TaxID=258256 RepID=UPI000B302C4E|nr:glycerophosphodiester phosphodiesterase family protein [Pseudovibrio denitrificans]
MFKKIALFLLLAAAGIYLYNASWLTFDPSSGKPKFIAHRGVHQTYHRENLTNKTCTAERIDTPSHPYLENTIASMQAAFEAGADIVELDIHPTTDNKLAVFHDWTVDCRTNGSGITRIIPSQSSKPWTSPLDTPPMTASPTRSEAPALVQCQSWTKCFSPFRKRNS